MTEFEVPDVYICSKPLQYFNIKNIGKIEGCSNKRILIVVKLFCEASEFVNNIREYDKCWDLVLDIEDRNHYFDYIKTHKINYLFVENDSSFKMTYFMMISKITNRVKKLYVYEEGLGTYRNDLHFGIDKIIRYIFLVGTHYGASPFCSNVILYEPNLYNNKFHTKKAIGFSNSFLDGMKIYGELIRRLCGHIPDYLQIKNRNILIYITNHDIDNHIIEKMTIVSDDYDAVFIKPHPHIRKIELKSAQFKVISTNIMVEYIYYLLIKNGNRLTVWHQASTSVVYFMDKINSKNFIVFPIFDEFVNYLYSFKS